MNALHNFIRATASYFGAPVDQLTEGCAIDSSTGEFEVVLRFALAPADLEGIAKRMAAMATEQAQGEAIDGEVGATPTLPSNEALRAVWNELTAAQRSEYGSFGRFKAAHGVPDPYMPAGAVEVPVDKGAPIGGQFCVRLEGMP